MVSDVYPPVHATLDRHSDYTQALIKQWLLPRKELSAVDELRLQDGEDDHQEHLLEPLGRTYYVVQYLEAECNFDCDSNHNRIVVGNMKDLAKAEIGMYEHDAIHGELEYYENQMHRLDEVIYTARARKYIINRLGKMVAAHHSPWVDTSVTRVYYHIQSSWREIVYTDCTEYERHQLQSDHHIRARNIAVAAVNKIQALQDRMRYQQRLCIYLTAIGLNADVVIICADY